MRLGCHTNLSKLVTNIRQSAKASKINEYISYLLLMCAPKQQDKFDMLRLHSKTTKQEKIRLNLSLVSNTPRIRWVDYPKKPQTESFPARF